MASGRSAIEQYAAARYDSAPAITTAPSTRSRRISAKPASGESDTSSVGRLVAAEAAAHEHQHEHRQQQRDGGDGEDAARADDADADAGRDRRQRQRGVAQRLDVAVREPQVALDDEVRQGRPDHGADRRGGDDREHHHGRQHDRRWRPARACRAAARRRCRRWRRPGGGRAGRRACRRARRRASRRRRSPSSRRRRPAPSRSGRRRRARRRRTTAPRRRRPGTRTRRAGVRTCHKAASRPSNGEHETFSSRDQERRLRACPPRHRRRHAWLGSLRYMDPRQPAATNKW